MSFIFVFLYGFLAACAALLVEGTLLALTTPNLSFFVMIIPAAFVEEGLKWLFFRQYHRRFYKQIDAPSPLLSGVLFGLGFFAVEFGLISIGLKPLAFIPLGGILLVHLLTCLFFAYYLFRLTPRSTFHTWTLLGGMVVLHALYNVFVLF